MLPVGVKLQSLVTVYRALLLQHYGYYAERLVEFDGVHSLAVYD